MEKKSPIRFRLGNMEKATIPLPGFESNKFARFGHLWRLIGVLGLILTLYQVNILQIDYFTHPYDTRISVIKDENEAIPSMEICIFNKVQCSMIKRNLQDPREKLVHETCQILIHSQCSVPPDLIKICRANNAMFESDLETSANLTMRERDLAIDTILGSSVPLQQKLNEDYENFIYSCYMNNQSCFEYQHSNVTVGVLQPSFNPAIGACAKLNWNGSIKIDEQGLNVEIVVKLNVEDPTHQGVSGAQGGVKVTFDREKAFRTEKNVIYVRPNTYNTMIVAKSRVRNLPDPYLAKCTSGWENTAIAGMNEDFKRTVEEFTYDLETCSNLCQLERTYNECDNCLWSKYEEGSFQTEFYKKFTRTLLHCNETDPKVEKCLQQSEIKDTKQACRCREPCLKIEYKVLSSSVQWPNCFNWQKIGTSVGLINDTQLTGLSANHPEVILAQEKVQQSLLKIKVIQRTKEIREFEQVGKYESWTVIDSLGGATSLYVGISFVTIIEIIEYGIDYLRRMIN